MIKNLILSLILLGHASADALHGTPKSDLKSALQNFNLFEKQSKEANELLSFAYDFLSEEKDRSCYDLSLQESFQKSCAEMGLTYLGGPMLGDVRSDACKVWVRTLAPAEVSVVIGEKTYGPVKSTQESDLSAIVQVTGLTPSTSYPYKLLINGEEVATPKEAQITTTSGVMNDGKVRLAFGSCFHRWGIGNTDLTEAIMKREPAACVFIGDISGQGRTNQLGMHRFDNLTRDLYVNWQAMVSRLPVYSSWDDHDYFLNDLAGSPVETRNGKIRYTEEEAQAVLKVWKQSWNNKSYGLGGKDSGLFQRLNFGPVDVLMMDTRYHREKGNFLGDMQMEWLKEQLLDCKAPFIVISGGTMFSDYVSKGKDSWGVYDPEGREELFQFIEDNNIKGVLLISGDRHGARGFTIPRESGFSFYEFGAASLGGRHGPPVTSPHWTTQLYGIEKQYAFGEFEIDASLPDPEVTFNLIGDDESIIYSLTLKRSTLTPKSK